jgi:predicted alpha/beta hydrolase
MVAVQKGYWALWPSPRRYGVLAFFGLGVPLALRSMGRLPLRLVGLEDLPPGAARDWARWGLHDEFFDSSLRGQAKRFGDVRVPILGISVDDDYTYAPKPAVDWLYDRYYKNAPGVRCHIVPGDYGLGEVGHSGFFRSRVAPVVWWDDLSAWLAGATATDPQSGLNGGDPRSLWRSVVGHRGRDRGLGIAEVVHA